MGKVAGKCRQRGIVPLLWEIAGKMKATQLKYAGIPGGPFHAVPFSGGFQGAAFNGCIQGLRLRSA
jgi:hypothetical protein